MKNEFKGIGKVFRFTCEQQIKKRSYRVWTILLALLCFLIPFAAISITAAVRSSDQDNEQSAPPCRAEELIIVDDSGLGLDFAPLASLGTKQIKSMKFSSASTTDEALVKRMLLNCSAPSEASGAKSAPSPESSTKISSSARQGR